MKKSVKRILCSVLSLSLASTLAVEHVLRMNAESAQYSTEASASFEDVTGQYDTTSLRTDNFNSQVQEADITPTYETRTVIVSLSKNSLVDAAAGEPVADFADSFTGQKIASDIKAQQQAFLKTLKEKGISYKLERSYNTLMNAVAIEVNTRYVSTIKKLSGVKSAVITTTYSAPDTVEEYSSSDSQKVFNETSVYKTGIYNSDKYTDVTGSGENDYGEGMVVAVLDTGLDYTHSAFHRTPQNQAWNKTTVSNILNGNTLTAETKSGTLTVNDVYVSDKVPFAYDYADDDPDVYPSYSNHGTHVAGIIGGYDASGYTDKDGNIVWEDTNNDGIWDDDEVVTPFRGVVPDAQLVICKVFTDDLDDPELGGAKPEDIIAALEDCVTLGVDVINMSLGTSCGFSTTDDGDDEGDMLNNVYESIKTQGISLVCAASNDYSSGYGGAYGTNLKENPDSSTVGSPSTFSAALSVASISGQKSPYMVAEETGAFIFYEEARDENSKPFDFAESMLNGYNEEVNGTPTFRNGYDTDGDGKHTFEYVVVPETGEPSNYSSPAIKNLFKKGNRIAVVQRGVSTFLEKVNTAKSMGAVGIIVYNNVAGLIRMNLGDIENPIPAVSVDNDAGQALIKAAGIDRLGEITIDVTNEAGPFMSEFSSWGPTHDLKLKPEITAHGGEITSTVPGGYGEQSGTSMASPNMAGVMAIVRSYIEKDLSHLVMDGDKISAVKVNRLANQLMMSTATTVYDQAGRPYSPRKQGAGLGSLENVISKTSAYLYTDKTDIDNRPKLELGDEIGDTFSMEFYVQNFGGDDLVFNTDSLVLTETVSGDKLAVAEQAYELSPEVVWEATGLSGGKITVPDGESMKIKVTVTLSEADKKQLAKFPNGMYVEGFLKLDSDEEANGEGVQCDLSIPFLGFYGDWDSLPMLDKTAFEVAEDEQDPSKENENVQASVWATQPYAMYYNEKYIIPMGGYVYLVDEYDDPVYADEKYCAISRYNVYYGEDVAENYLTTTGIKAVYAGLLRNARLVRYYLYNEQTGELLLTDTINRVGKAYSGGGSAVPANVELELRSEEQELVNNGQYRMEFEFFADYLYKDENDNPVYADTADGTYSFSFTVDYDAPVLEDVRLRYNTKKDGTKETKEIWLDIDVYDNNYAQALMLCYPVENAEGETVLQLATEYPEPIRKPNKNGTTTVSLNITELYDEYKEQLYVQIDDYALNSCLYKINMSEARSALLPEGDSFSLATGEDDITLGIYETHKVELVYSGSADLANFEWFAEDDSIAAVKDGEIVGLSPGTTTVVVTGKGGPQYSKEITVTVTDETTASLTRYPMLSFGVIKTDTKSLDKPANGDTVYVNAGETFTLSVKKDPWYHPAELDLVWESTDPSVATVNQKGEVTTLKKGYATISATVKGQVLYTASVMLRVQNEFSVSNYTLNDYNGVGYNTDDGVLEIPTDMNIMYIGEQAFKDNDNIKKIVIPASVTQIHERAFENCTALEEVYFVSTKHRVDDDGNVDTSIDWADISLVESKAFYGCKNLKLIDLSNVKVVTIASECFKDCTSLTTIVDMPSIGTAYHQAFANCTSLKNIDITGLHVSGESVFEGCTKLASITTGKFTAIGKNMFKNCTGLYKQITLQTPNVGEGAFSGCTNLMGVKFKSPEGEALEYNIGARAFENCGANQLEFTFDFGTEKILTIGSNAFKGTSLTSFELNDYIQLDALRFAGLALENITVTADSESTKYAGIAGVIYEKDENGNPYKILFANTALDRSYTVPEGVTVTAIGDYAFANSNFTSVAFGSALTSIGTGAFENSAIKSIDLSEATSLTSIPARAFYGSDAASVTLPASVKSVGDYAFAASAINSLTAAGLTSIGSFVFANCASLQEIALPDGIAQMGSYVFLNCTALTEVQLPSVKVDEDGNSLMGAYTFLGASKLDKVAFGADAETTGDYTFMGTPITKVTLVSGQTKIGEGAFNGCLGLESITLPLNIKEVGAYAFGGCRNLTTVANLQLVENIGAQAFYNTGITTLDLASAKKIGAAAFLAESYDATDVTAKYNNVTLSLPNVEEIGAYAFLNGGMQSVVLSDNVQKIGYGAFASAANLTEIKIGETDENANFIVLDGVLYRYIGEKSEKQYELVCYPTALAQTDGKYVIEEGTLLVQASAFYDLNEGMLEHVVFPHSVNAIGDNAFYNSGVTEYTFESIQAPALETIYRQEIVDAVEAQSTTGVYKGYFYTNFQTYLYNYTSFGKDTSDMILNYPTNGKGYDNYLYKLYFGERNTTKIEQTDTTREAIKALNALESSSVIGTWNTTNKDKSFIEEYALQIQAARTLYNSVIADAEQASFITAEQTTEFLAVEEAFRAVKRAFGINTSIKELKIDASSTHRTEYLVGEEFDLTGMVVIVVYEDGAQKTVGADELILQTTGALKKTNRSVRITYSDGTTSKTGTISITVKEPVSEQPDDSSTSSDPTDSSGEQSSSDNGCKSTVSVMSAVVGVTMALGVCLVKRRKED